LNPNSWVTLLHQFRKGREGEDSEQSSNSINYFAAKSSHTRQLSFSLQLRRKPNQLLSLKKRKKNEKEKEKKKKEEKKRKEKKKKKKEKRKKECLRTVKMAHSLKVKL